MLKNLSIISFIIFVTLQCYSQRVKIINNDLSLVGKERFILVLKDSISKIIGIDTIPIYKTLLHTERYNYVEIKLRKNDIKNEQTIIVKIDNNYIDFSKSKGYIKNEEYIYSNFLTKGSYQEGFGKDFILEENLKNMLYHYAKESQKSITISTISGIITPITLSSYYLLSDKNNINITPIVAVGVVGSVTTIISFIKWINSYKYVKFYSVYHHSIDITNFKFN